MRHRDPPRSGSLWQWTSIRIHPALHPRHAARSQGSHGSMARRRLLDTGGRDGVLWARVLRDAHEENHPAAPRLGPHHLQRGVQRCRVAGSVMHHAIRLALSRYSDVSGAVRSILVDPWLLFCAGHLAFHFCKQKIDGARTGRRRGHVSFGCRRNLLFCLFLFDMHTRHLGSISLCADHGLGGGGGPHCLLREQEQAFCSHRFA